VNNLDYAKQCKDKIDVVGRLVAQLGKRFRRIEATQKVRVVRTSGRDFAVKGQDSVPNLRRVTGSYRRKKSKATRKSNSTTIGNT